MTHTEHMLEDILAGLEAGVVVPYLGAGVLALSGADCPLPARPEDLVDRLTAKATVPHKIRKNLTAAAQYIENFKHRKTVAVAMTEAFSPKVAPTALHQFLARLNLPLIVHAWYDDLMQQALSANGDWRLVQGVSQAEHFGHWVHYFNPQGERADHAEGKPLLYEPWGAVTPAKNFLVSDSDFVEVLTEIDIQTPIPEPVQNLRRDRNFLFLGCRFNTQLDRAFAQQVIKRSSDKHWAVIAGDLTRNEERFLETYNITRIDLPLPDFARMLAQQPAV